MPTRERIVQEIRDIGLVTAYFLAWFLFFLGMKKLLLAEYEIQISVLGTAVVGALVVAKVVVILENTRLGTRFQDSRRVYHIAYRSVVYTAIVFAVTVVERLFDLYREHGGLQTALEAGWAQRDVHHFLALNICVALAFLVYNTYAEIDPHLGEGGLHRFLLRR